MQVRLLDCHPDLGADLDPLGFRRAHAVLTCPVITVGRGPVDLDDAQHQGRHGRAFACMVIDGLLERAVTLGGYTATCLVGPRDLIGTRPPSSSSPPARSTFTALTPARIAILDDRFTACLKHWPRLAERLNDTAMEQVGRACVHQAVSQLPRAESRLLALFWLLADRWGTVGPDGVRLDLALTHEALGRLIGARRPTVSLALRELGESGQVLRLPTGGWVLAQDSLELLAA